MNPRTIVALMSLLCVFDTASLLADDLLPIETVELGNRQEFRVNGRPFIPIMIWLQPAENFETARRCGINTVAGYWPGSSGTKDVTEYVSLVKDAGLYAVVPFSPDLRGNDHVLGYIHGDEPDLPHQVSDAEVIPAENLRLNPKAPLWKLVDGVETSWSVLDPLAGARVTIRPAEPSEIVEVGVSLTVSTGLSVAKEIVWSSGGRELVRQSLAPKKGIQTVRLPKPVRVEELTFEIVRVDEGANVWGSLGEVVAKNEAGVNVLESPPHNVPRAAPDKVLEEYRRIKEGDPSRPVFVTFTGYFHPHFGKWDDAERSSLYRAYIQAADVVGYDIYPIYGWNKPEWIELVYGATGMLRELAAPRPVYAWIETSKGGQYTGPLERQKEVTPRHIRAEVWMALCNGARAIGYFTHVWQPSYKQFGVPPQNQQALAEINAQITRLTDALTASPFVGITTQTEDDTRVAVQATETASVWYVFAVNYDHRERATTVHFRFPKSTPWHESTTITVVDEARTIPCRNGEFEDHFGAFDVHIYRIPKPAN
ncbi:hypothetical protein JCM19992_25580 [Thermostilla marina]